MVHRYTAAHSDNEYLMNVVRRIETAAVNVRGTVYTFDDPDLVQALIRAKRRGVDVEICADNQQFHNPSSTRQPSSIVEMIEAEIRARVGRGLRTTHQKTWLIDETIAFIGSGNATSNSRNNCSEFGVESTEYCVVASLKHKIATLWEEGREIDLNAARSIRGRSASSRR